MPESLAIIQLATGWATAASASVLALVAPATDQVVALFDFFEEAGNFFGVVLQIPVHGNDDFAAGEIEAGFNPAVCPKLRRSRTRFTRRSCS